VGNLSTSEVSRSRRGLADRIENMPTSPRVIVGGTQGWRRRGQVRHFVAGDHHLRYGTMEGKKGEQRSPRIARAERTHDDRAGVNCWSGQQQRADGDRSDGSETSAIGISGVQTLLYQKKATPIPEETGTDRGR